MIQPPISLSPTRLHRPPSATRRTGSATSRGAPQPSSAAVSKSHHVASSTSHKVSAFSAQQQQQLPSSPTVGNGRDDALVANLKQQIQCLEMEVKYLRSGPSPTAAAAGSRPGSAPHHTLESPSALSMDGSMLSRKAVNDAALLRRADELEVEVEELKSRYATSEQAHQLEIASLRQQLDADSRNRHAARDYRGEMERYEQHMKQSMTDTKALHAQEVVALQRTVERLQLELDNARSLNHQLAGDKEGIAKELITLKDNLRQSIYSMESAQRQHQEAMSHLTSEQGVRRGLELQVAQLKEAADVTNQGTQRWEKKVSDLEDSNRQLQAEVQSKQFDIDQNRVVIEKQRADLAKAAGDLVDMKAKSASVLEKLPELEQKLAKAVQGLTDVQSEKEFFRLQCDRLKVESSVLEVKCAQSEQALQAERVSLVAVERQLCAALEQIDTLRREAKEKESIYRGIDTHASEARMRLLTTADECAALKKQMDELTAKYKLLDEKYDKVRHLADAEKTEAQLQHALQSLAKSKREMQEVLSAQQRIASEVSHMVVDIPDTMQISRALTPPRGRRANMSVDVSDVTEIAQPPLAPAPLHSNAALESTSTPTSVEAVRRELEEMARRVAEHSAEADNMLGLH